MKGQGRPPSVFSKVSVGGRTVILVAVLQRLDLKPGDTLRYRFGPKGVRLEKAVVNNDSDPFFVFSEWGEEVDDKAYRCL